MFLPNRLYKLIERDLEPQLGLEWWDFMESKLDLTHLVSFSS
jgi:hypothetical protein